ncbi:polymer-forming cytoskeletal protein [Clostridium hydrogeniformans]|uniref:polymer-forming cytoskeletal protein n=1 Tax=Clostridium hydrogeniformans TaxID=349933 RepID=UPI000485C79E|nr:polymer-forming cytoskeletal protein [Clostridium hydrogeniformans]
MEEKLMDLKISGSSTMPGGKYDSVKISGSGKINGDVICSEFKVSGSGALRGSLETITGKVSGSASIQGNIKCGDFKFSGSASVGGNLEGGNIHTSGSTKVEGRVKGKSLNVSGSMKIGEGIYVNDIDICGSLKSGGDCEGERFISQGGFNIRGLLTADVIDIGLAGDCYAKEIGGEKIIIKRVRNNGGFLRYILSLVNINNGVLNTELIEGDYVEVNYTRCNIIRGKKVVVGKGSVIDKVEYTDEIIIENGGVVKEEVKVQ